MNKIAKFAIACSAASLAVVPTIAMAASGYMTCQVADSDRGHVFFSEKAFVADSGDADKAFTRYLKELMDEKVPLLKSLDHAKGICNWETTAAEANKKTSQFVIHYIQQGYLTYSDNHMSDPFVP